MQTEMIANLKKSLEEMDKQIVEAKELISLLKVAGEDTIEIENNFRALEKRKLKWQSALKEKGY